MEKIIANAFGCKIIERDLQTFVQFDGGDIVVNIVEYPISQKEIDRLLVSEQEAYKVLLEIQNRSKG